MASSCRALSIARRWGLVWKTTSFPSSSCAIIASAMLMICRQMRVQRGAALSAADKHRASHWGRQSAGFSDTDGASEQDIWGRSGMRFAGKSKATSTYVRVCAYKDNDAVSSCLDDLNTSEPRDLCPVPYHWDWQHLNPLRKAEAGKLLNTVLGSSTHLGSDHLIPPLKLQSEGVTESCSHACSRIVCVKATKSWLPQGKM